MHNGATCEENIQKKMEHSLRNLRIADLELFLSAARIENLGKAAAIHHLSQSAASTAIQRVESAFRVELCTHERKRFRLTKQGKVLLPRLERVIEQIRDLIVANDVSPIRVVTTHAIAQVVVPSLFSLSKMDFQQMRPDSAYRAVLEMEADLALVLDNAPWKAVGVEEVGRGSFRLCSRNPDQQLKPVLLPEEQMEVLFLQQTWLQEYGYPLPVKSRISSWSLIGQICSESDEVGFLPDFLAKKFGLEPVAWQPAPSPYRVLAIYREGETSLQGRFDEILQLLKGLFYHSEQRDPLSLHV